MLSNSSLKKDTIFYGAATLAERFISLLIIPILTKNLCQELYGVWTQIIVTTTLVSNVVLIGFHISAVRFLAGNKDNREISNTFHSMLFIVLLNSLIVLFLTFIFAPTFGSWIFGESRFVLFAILFGFYLVCESLFELTTAFLRARKEIKLLSIYYFIKNVVRITVLALGILLFRLNLFQTIALIIVLQVFLVVFIYIKDILRKVGFSAYFRNVNWKEILSFSVPLVPYNLLISANFFVNRYFILHILNINYVSIYAVAYSLSAIVGLFYSILGYTLYPHMANLWNNGNKSGAAEMFCQAIKYYLFFAIPFIAVLTILSAPLIKILSTSEYLSSWYIIFWLSSSIGIFGLYQLNYYITLLANKTLFNLNLASVALLVNVILNIVLIPKIGILGAAIATFVSNAVLALWTIGIGKKYLSYIFPWSAISKIVPATFIVSLFLLIFMHYFDMSNLYILIFTGIGAAAIYMAIDLFNKNSILFQLKKNIRT